LALHRSTKRRQLGTEAERELVARIHALSERYPRLGSRKLYALLKGEHWRVSRETVRRIRQREGLQVVQRTRKKRPVGVSTTTPTRAAHPNHVWSYDFVHNETTDGRRLKCLTVLDEYTREGLTIHCARSTTAEDVVQVLQGLQNISKVIMVLSSSRSGSQPGCARSGSRPILLTLGARGRTGITRALTGCFAMAA
jgi:putative transposase